MAGLVPAIHVFAAKTWMPSTAPSIIPPDCGHLRRYARTGSTSGVRGLRRGCAAVQFLAPSPMLEGQMPTFWEADGEIYFDPTSDTRIGIHF